MERFGDSRDASQQTQEYTVSFELGTIGDLGSQPPSVSGIQLQDLSKYTTIGLFQDVDTSYGDDDSDESKTEMEVESKEEEHDETCSICQERLIPHSIVRQINRCKHLFHQGCIEQWLCEHTTCPLCMQSVEDDVSNNTSDTDDNQTDIQERMLNLVANELGI